MLHINPTTMAERFIWEIGANHMGSVDKAKRMMDGIKEQGGINVKLQWFDPDKLATPRAIFKNGRRQRAVLWDSSMTWDEMAKVIHHGRNIGLNVGCTVFSAEDAGDLQDVFGDDLIAFFKVASPDMIDTEMIKTYLLDDLDRPVFISTGGATEGEISQLADFLLSATGLRLARGRIVLMHCVSQYPAFDYGFPRWAVLSSLVNEAKGYFKIGYSHHGRNDWPMAHFLALGAQFVEAHVCDDQDDVDKNVSVRVDRISKVLKNLESKPLWPSDTDDIHLTRRYWVTTANMTQETPLVPGESVQRMRCHTTQTPISGALTVSDHKLSKYRLKLAQPNMILPAGTVLTSSMVELIKE